MSKKELAVKSFDSGYNCAQSVLMPFADDLHIDKETAIKFAQGFGAGMGGLQYTCGAITGAYMVIGMKYSKGFPYPAINNKVESLIQEFTQKFKEKNGHTNCSELLQCDLKTPEGQRNFAENKLHDNVCSKCVASSVDILNELIK